MRRIRSRERGAALVEFAILMPLLLMLILGIVSVGVAYNHQLSMTHAAREGGRFAATLPVSSYADKSAWLDAVSTYVVADATGSMDAGTPGRIVCVAYVYPDGTDPSDPNGGPDPTERRLDDGTITRDNNPCFVDGRPASERRVQVQIAREADFNALVFSTTVTLDAQAVSRFEAAPGV